MKSPNLFSLPLEDRDWKSEAEYQAACVKYFESTYPDKIGQLMLLYNNPPNSIIGAKLISMGLKRGAADLLYFYEYKHLALIELKIGANKQTPQQHTFEDMVTSYGFNYFLLRSQRYGQLDAFINLIKKLNGII